jgi:hypothetical protein
MPVINNDGLLSRVPYGYVKTLYVGTEVGEAGHHLYHAAHLTEHVGIAQASAQFATAHLLVRIDAYHYLPAGVHLDPGPGLQWNHSLQKKQAELTGQDLRLEAQMERKAWSRMEMALLIQFIGEIPNSDYSAEQSP